MTNSRYLGECSVLFKLKCERVKGWENVLFELGVKSLRSSKRHAYFVHIILHVFL